MRKLKIVHCLFSMDTGGAQVLAIGLMNEMCATHEMCLVVVNDKLSKNLIEQVDKRVKVYYINRKEGSRNPLPILRLNILLLQIRPDIIHCHEPNMVKALKMVGCKFLYTIHDVGIPVVYYDLYHSLVAISDAVYADVSSRCSYPLVTVYNGIAAQLFKQRKYHFAKENDSYKIVQISRVEHEKKGHDILLHALHKAIYVYGFVNISLEFIGEASGPSFIYLDDLVKKLRLEKHVKFIGEKNREWLFENLCSYDILVQPSRFEGFGLTILEGFAAGLPVLASDIDGPAEIIESTPGGFLFPNGDINACVHALIHIINLYRSDKISDVMYRTISNVAKKYSMKSCAKGYSSEYARLSRSRSVNPV